MCVSLPFTTEAKQCSVLIAMAHTNCTFMLLYFYTSKCHQNTSESSSSVYSTTHIKLNWERNYPYKLESGIFQYNQKGKPEFKRNRQSIYCNVLGIIFVIIVIISCYFVILHSSYLLLLYSLRQ